MPEGPEVANFVRSIASFLGEGERLLSVTPLSGRYTKKPIEGLSATQLPLVIETVSCKGKFIYWTFKGTETVIFNTLGMSGAWSNTPRNARVKFETSAGDLFFNDARSFGTLKLSTRKELATKLVSLGPDMLNEDVSASDFKTRMWQHPDLTLAEALMNQGIVSGVGNYLKADSLWLAKLSPHRLISQCTIDDLDTLWASVRMVIKGAFLNGGSTISTYVGFDGKNGGHTMLVYCRKTDPNGEVVVPVKTKDGRSTWWSPQFQL